MNDEDNPSEPADSPSRPLDLLVRAVDHLLAARTRDILADEHLGGREWMLLRTLSDDPDDLDVTWRSSGRAEKLHGLVERGWIVPADDAWALTDDGRAAVTRIAERVRAAHAEITDAASADDLRTTIASLEAIARAAGADDRSAAQEREHGRGHGDGHGHKHGHGHGHEHGARHRQGHGFGHEHGLGREDGRGREHSFGHEHGFGREHGHGLGQDHGHRHRHHDHDRRLHDHDRRHHDHDRRAPGAEPHADHRAGCDHGGGLGPRRGQGFGARRGQGIGPRRHEQAFERGFESGFRAARPR